MKLIGEKIFAKDAEGRLLSRIGTLFFRTPGMVTQRGAHAMQRLAWVEALNAERAAAGKPPLTPAEEEEEMSESVDLVFTEDHVLIRPNPERMDLAFRADEELQKIVSKPAIRFLNTSSMLVRKALCERGENWRMARQPVSQEDMAELIASSKIRIDERPIYYYNRITGTRFLTVGGYAEVEKLPMPEFRRQIAEIVAGLNKRNRAGQPEVDFFPSHTPIEIRRTLKTMKPAELGDAELKAACDKLVMDWRMALPAELREESEENFEWRNAMCHALTAGPNETSADEQDLVAGIAPEFYRQIEWLPGARIEADEVVFDSVYAQAARTGDPALLALCDTRVKSFLFNTTRLFGRVRYINIGRITQSLARRPVAGQRRGCVYIMQYADEGMETPQVLIIRLQKWGIAEHLDEGKDLLQATVEADDYSEYILDRRLMCRQLGMNLPRRIGYGRFTETYRGDNKYNGYPVRTGYFVRAYVPGMASDKVPAQKYRNPAWAQKFAFLMGQAAAIDLVVGRRSTATKEVLFDRQYEIVQTGEDGMPSEILVTDHAGSFVDYANDMDESVGEYAQFATSRRQLVGEYGRFAQAYVEGFRRRLKEVQDAYLGRRQAFDGLLSDRPYDTNGSGAYRWDCALKRLAACDPDRLADMLKAAVGC